VLADASQLADPPFLGEMSKAMIIDLFFVGIPEIVKYIDPRTILKNAQLNYLIPL
jgi:hypothetical protein